VFVSGRGCRCVDTGGGPALGAGQRGVPLTQTGGCGADLAGLEGSLVPSAAVQVGASVSEVGSAAGSLSELADAAEKRAPGCSPSRSACAPFTRKGPFHSRWWPVGWSNCSGSYTGCPRSSVRGHPGWSPRGLAEDPQQRPRGAEAA